MAEQLESEDFDTAKAVFEKLKDVPLERRRRILSWVAEGLGVALQSAPPSVAPPATSSDRLATPAVSLGHSHQNPPTDIRTFVGAKEPKSDVQFAAAVAYYYRFEAPAANRRETINGDTLQDATRRAGRKRLTNPRATLNNAKNVGYLDSNSPGEFSINSVGENLVAMTLPGIPEGGGNSKRATRMKRAKKKSGRKG